MYTPYAEQTIAILLYILLTIPLLIVNSKRMVGTTRFIFTRNNHPIQKWSSFSSSFTPADSSK